jgi:hypothetical protein
MEEGLQSNPHFNDTTIQYVKDMPVPKVKLSVCMCVCVKAFKLWLNLFHTVTVCVNLVCVLQFIFGSGLINVKMWTILCSFFLCLQLQYFHYFTYSEHLTLFTSMLT